MLEIGSRLKGQSVAVAANDGETFHLKGGGGSIDPNDVASMLAERLGVKRVTVVASNPPLGGIAVVLCGVPDGEIRRARCEYYRWH